MWKKTLFGFILIAATACTAQKPVSQPARTAESCSVVQPLQPGTYVILVDPGEGRFHRPETAPPAQSIPNRGATEGDELE